MDIDNDPSPLPPWAHAVLGVGLIVTLACAILALGTLVTLFVVNVGVRAFWPDVPSLSFWQGAGVMFALSFVLGTLRAVFKGE